MNPSGGVGIYEINVAWPQPGGLVSKVLVPAISNTYSGKHRTVNGSSFVLQAQSKKVFEVISF